MSTQCNDASTGDVYLRARWYAPGQGRFLTKDAWEGDSTAPLSYNDWLYALANPIRYTDPYGLDVGCNVDDPEDQRCHQRVNARVFYLNAIGLGKSGTTIAPNPNPADEQGYLIYKLGERVGKENVKHIPIFKNNTNTTRCQMWGEMFEIRSWSPIVAGTISDELQRRPLAYGESLVIVGNSGGGTIAIESLDLLQEKGIFVDHIILRGSPVLELSLRNVGQVDYITSRWDYYYSFDINPLDGIKVREIKLNFYGHKLTSNTVRKQVGDLIPYLLDH